MSYYGSGSPGGDRSFQGVGKADWGDRLVAVALLGAPVWIWAIVALIQWTFRTI